MITDRLPGLSQSRGNPVLWDPEPVHAKYLDIDSQIFFFSGLFTQHFALFPNRQGFERALYRLLVSSLKLSRIKRICFFVMTFGVNIN